jgi:arylamine N-acetyltransferase
MGESMPNLLSPALTEQVLAHLGVAQAEPNLGLLERLIEGYGQRVPWESASRIARVAGGQASPRWADEFWADALGRGTGGTCYESNWAFFALLRSLGYSGYLTINNMHESIGCHTAIVVQLAGQPWLVDVGLPIYVALPLDPQATTERASPYLAYQAQPTSAGRYRIGRSPHPKSYAFDLIDEPVDDVAYQRATAADYGPTGLFLQQVIINKLVDGAIWRFNSAEPPYQLQHFDGPVRSDYQLTGDIAAQLGAHFAIDAAVVAAALAQLAEPSSA